MSSLKSYVNELFSKYNGSKNVNELKEEILSNLEAKITDLTAAGMDYDDAINEAKKSITNIDCLIEGNKNVYKNQYKLECLQIALLYILIAWIITIPVQIIGMGIILNKFLFILSIVIGGTYVFFNFKKEPEYLKQTVFLNFNSALKTKRIVWLIWVLFFSVSVLYTSALYFGSNIWFSRPISIDGPYAFATLSIRYFLPVVSIIIPMFANCIPKLILKYEVGENNENTQ